jgi:hypothetical protein
VPSDREEDENVSEQPQDDDSVLENLDEVVDVVLGEGIAPDEPESPWERRQRILDSWTAIILAIAAVATAWASFQASNWSERQSDAQAASSILRADSGRAQTAATQQTIIDSQTWLEWVSAVAAGQKAKADFLDNRFSPSLKVAQTEWLAGVQLDAQGVPVTIPPGTPLDLPSYVVPEQLQADADAVRAEELLADANDAAENSTQFVLLAVLLALVLFFASVATKFTGPKVQVLLTSVSLVLLVGCTIRLVALTLTL